MKVLIFTLSNYILDILVDFFIPSGITPFYGEGEESIIQKIHTNKIDAALIDLNRENFDYATRIIQRIRTHPYEEVKKCAIVLYIEGVSKELVAKALSLGACGFIKRNTPKDEAVNMLMEACKRMTGKYPDQKHIKIKLNPEIAPEDVAVKFISPKTEQSILGIMREMSIIGCIIEIKGDYVTTGLEKGMIIENIKFLLLGKEVVVDTILAAYANRKAALLFHHMSRETAHDISQYIFRKLANLI